MLQVRQMSALAPLPPRNVVAASFARNSVWNLLGQVLPMAAALICIPLLVRQLGIERFGILTLISAAIGYFGLFDLGIARSLTKFVAERTDLGEGEESARLIWTALTLLLALSVVGAVIVVLLAPWLTRTVLSVSLPFQRETVGSLCVLALGFPMVFAGNGLRGVLEARGRFGLTNAVRAPLGVFSFAGPLLALKFANSIVAVTAALVASWALACTGYLALCLKVNSEMRRHIGFDPSVVGPLVRLGSWMTVSTVVSPFMVYLDRFVIGAVASMAVVAYYTAPYAVVSKLWVLPLSLIGVLFPLFSRAYLADRGRVSSLLFRGIRYVSLLLFPPVLVIVALAREGLAWWLGQGFAEHSATVLQILAAAVFFNSLAQVAFALVQAVGRADLTARLHLVELPLYLGALWVMIASYGVVGAAITWAARVIVDAVVLYAFVWRLVPECRQEIRRAVGGALATGATFVAAALLRTTGVRVGFVLGGLLISAVIAWRFVLTADDRTRIRHPLAALVGTQAK